MSYRIEKYRSAASNDDAQVLTCNLNDLIRDSKWIDPKQLCIAPEKLVWTLYCDYVCLDYDGSILDASVVALTTALRSLTLPKINYDIETTNYTVDESIREPLVLSETCPVSTTCMVFDEKIIFADPDAEEEELSNAIVTIATCNGEICLVNKPGGQAIGGKQFDECLKLALNRERSICRLISSVLKGQ